MSIVIRAYRCPCGKLHCAAGASSSSRCTCGRLLLIDMFRAAS